MKKKGFQIYEYSIMYWDKKNNESFLEFDLTKCNHQLIPSIDSIKNGKLEKCNFYISNGDLIRNIFIIDFNKVFFTQKVTLGGNVGRDLFSDIAFRLDKSPFDEFNFTMDDVVVIEKNYKKPSFFNRFWKRTFYDKDLISSKSKWVSFDAIRREDVIFKKGL